MLLSETNEEGSLLRSYITETDEYGKLISLTVKDTSGGRKTYYYLYNGTGEIVGLVDEEGNIVVKYSYDSWGVPTEYQYNQTTGTWEEVPVGTFTNPYLYKSYYYDTETGLTT
jgi:YD repeat-containing protein